MKYFGTDGFRGEANKELNVYHAFKIGRLLGWYYGKRVGKDDAKILIGKDTRRSSYMFESALSAGITSSGADAYLLHVTTTPSVSYIARSEDFDCGIMISASHNPFFDNGIKLLNSDGYKMEESVLEEIEKYIDSDDDYIPLSLRNDIGRTIDYILGRNRYIAYLSTVVRRSFKGYRVLLDVSNGSAYSIAKNVFDILGADVTIVNNNPDGFNINEECGSTHVEKLVEMVKNGNYDVAFAYDGDADRCLAIDETGNIVTGDHIMYVFGKTMKEKGSLVDDVVVTTTMSNLGLFKAFDEIGIKTVVTDVGDKYVSEEISKNGYSVGGEQSGHIILSKYATTGDGVLTSLKLLEAIIESKASLSLFTRDLKIFPQILKNIVVKDKKIVLNDEDVTLEIQKVSEELGKNGRILVRPSGTEPKIRVMVEAETDELCEIYVERVIQVIKNKGYEV
ncbi:MAG: phosphoglucosamine mutase [Tissierellia bacterium]|nr:phosphoglucosamine mutase [Tissierellia bacterium]